VVKQYTATVEQKEFEECLAAVKQHPELLEQHGWLHCLLDSGIPFAGLGERFVMGLREVNLVLVCTTHSILQHHYMALPLSPYGTTTGTYSHTEAGNLRIITSDRSASVASSGIETEH
jgi:hypothetical protein